MCADGFVDSNTCGFVLVSLGMHVDQNVDFEMTHKSKPLVRCCPPISVFVRAHHLCRFHEYRYCGLSLKCVPGPQVFSLQLQLM